MAGNDVFLWEVPSDANANDVRLRDPNTGVVGYTLIAETGTYTITGSSASVLRGYRLNAESGSYSVTGQAATILKTKRLTADSGAYGVTGQAANIVYTPSGGAYTLTAASGSYLVSGSNATITFSGGLVNDTHDGFWRKQWEQVAKQSKATKKLEKKKKVIEEAPAEIFKLEQLPIIETVKPIKVKSNKLLVDKPVVFNYDNEEDDEDLLMLW